METEPNPTQVTVMQVMGGLPATMLYRTSSTQPTVTSALLPLMTHQAAYRALKGLVKRGLVQTFVEVAPGVSHVTQHTATPWTGWQLSEQGAMMLDFFGAKV